MADPRLFAIHELDPQVAESASATPGETATLQLLHRPTEAYQLDVHGFASGPVSVEEASCTDQARMRLPSGDAHYVISLPVRGAVLAMYRGKELDLRPGQAVVFQPPAEAVMTTDDDFDVLVVRVDAAALEDALEGQLGYPVRRPLPLAPTLDLDSAAGRGWATLLRYLVNAAVPGGPLANPVIAEPLQNSLLGWLLQAIDHPYREALDGSVRSWGPRTVRHRVDTIEAFPQRPLTTAGLAADAGMNVRVLQQCWRRHRDVTPMGYLRGVRLACAHRDLEEHAPGDTTVSATAFNWGFARPARFTTRYTRRYGLPPHQTLRGAAYA
ncbi:MAG TPA: AraC family transcriptional regulator [Pseudonocardiaceae bacterium]|nr:AraC family transcriptional regulator [Pseudonocardiaceae bacterium]